MLNSQGCVVVVYPCILQLSQLAYEKMAARHATSVSASPMTPSSTLKGIRSVFSQSDASAQKGSIHVSNQRAPPNATSK